MKPNKEPRFELGQRVHVSSITSRRIVSEIVDRFQDEEEGDWFYSLDHKNYLQETMISEAPVEAK